MKSATESQIYLALKETDTEARSVRNVVGSPGDHVSLLPPRDVLETLESVTAPVKVVMLDPWYNKGVGGIHADYDDWLAKVVKSSERIADHVYVWGFPKIVWRLLDHLPSSLSLVAWLTWYY